MMSHIHEAMHEVNVPFHSMMLICYCRERRDNIVSKYHSYDAFSLLTDILSQFFFSSQTRNTYLAITLAKLGLVTALKLKQELFQQYFLQMTLLHSRNALCVPRDVVGSGVTSHEISSALSKGTGDSVSFKQSLCMYAVHQFSLIEDNYFNFHH